MWNTYSEISKEVFVMRLEGATKKAEVTETITFDQFHDYYNWLSCSIIDDDTFVKTVETAWQVSENDINQEKMDLCITILKDTAKKQR